MIVERSVQRCGSSGAVFAASESSTGEASSRPTLPEEGFLPVLAEHHADVGRADVRRLDQHVLDRQPGPVVVEVADGEAPVAHRRLRVDEGLGSDQPVLDRVRDRERLEHRPELVAPLRRPVEQRAVRRIALGGQRRPGVRVEVRQARERPDLAGVGLHEDADRALGPHLGHALLEHVLERRLRVEVDRQPERLLDPGRIAQPPVEDPLDAGDADDFRRVNPLAPVAGPAEHVRRECPVRVKPRLARAEEQPGLAEVMDELALLGRDRALDPQELPPVGELAVEPVGVEVGEDRRQAGRRLPSDRSSPAAAHRARR